MMRALIEGVTDPEAMVELARDKLCAKLPQLQKTLTGRFREHHAFLLQRMLSHVDDLEADIAALTERIEVATIPFEAHVTLLENIPGHPGRGAPLGRGHLGRDRPHRVGTPPAPSTTTRVQKPCAP
jgi:transposase